MFRETGWDLSEGPLESRVDTQPSPLRDCTLLKPGATPRPFLVSHPTLRLTSKPVEVPEEGFPAPRPWVF